MNHKNRVLEFREKKGLTQEELAGVLGVSRQTIIAIEKGKYLPTLELAFRIAKFFSKNIEEVFLLK